MAAPPATGQSSNLRTADRAARRRNLVTVLVPKTSPVFMAIAYASAVGMDRIPVSMTNDSALCLRRHGQADSRQSYHKNRIALRSKLEVYGRDC
jgi:hypothetical protein